MSIKCFGYGVSKSFCWRVLIRSGGPAILILIISTGTYPHATICHRIHIPPCSSLLVLLLQVNEHEKLADSNTGDGPSSLGTRSPSGGSPREGSQTHNKFPWADGAGGGADAMIGSEEGTMHLRPYNQRIELPSVEDLSEGEGGRPEGGEVGDDDGGTHDFDEDELTRDKVKKAATKVRAINSETVKEERGLDVCGPYACS